MSSSSSSQFEHQLYRRPLPVTCISFSSQVGKRLFRESLTSGHMECYFRLAPQLSTQDETAYCGLTSLVMVLNALAVDPRKVWRSPWRWYHENTLECDSRLSLKFIRRHGMTLDQVATTARLNSLGERVTHLTSAVSLDSMRRLVSEYSKRDDAFLVFNFSRGVLQQTAGGHISPMGGYHPGRDMVLILDVARFKYPVYWAPLPLLYEAMKKTDHASGKPRGVIELWRRDSPPLTLFEPAGGLSATAGSRQLHSVSTLVQHWHAWLRTHWDQWAGSTTNTSAIYNEGCREFVAALLELDDDVRLLTTRSHAACPTHSADYLESFQLSVINHLENLPVYSAVNTVFAHLSPNDKDKLRHAFSVAHRRCEKNCAIANRLSCAHFVSFLLACWPSPHTGGESLCELTLNQSILAGLTNDTMQTELVTISKHLFDLFRQMYT